ncbi:hypothetical protein ACRPFF_04670 [Neisseria sp. SLRRB23]|uniref:hypothetical protein n=1 Tax=Neisseria sp. SLRRB23 TaxID=3435199 RepID=UPI003D7F90F2
MCRWVALPLPELRNGCVPWVGAGGGRAVCCYDTVIPIYKGGLQPTNPANQTNPANAGKPMPSENGVGKNGGFGNIDGIVGIGESNGIGEDGGIGGLKPTLRRTLYPTNPEQLPKQRREPREFAVSLQNLRYNAV